MGKPEFVALAHNLTGRGIRGILTGHGLRKSLSVRKSPLRQSRRRKSMIFAQSKPAWSKNADGRLICGRVDQRVPELTYLRRVNQRGAKNAGGNNQYTFKQMMAGSGPAITYGQPQILRSGEARTTSRKRGS